ncbi:hypothetical protein OV208_25835 [Corallococcus sp. bb12-1]|uniref:hypothetical protein n=1 Tax=Corallococcus sp. bb12-1 TaxID=2996784 RepID=UPI002270A17C|nr:hypothetical protein [Corallococcus sp. bb12-1]MCY1044762.1 hypothetical protein [Corallococcus sp. bb12-1]
MSLPKTHFLDCTLVSPLMHLPVRTAVFELEQARVMLSPGSKLTAGQLQEAGPVTDIVAPSLMHTAGMKAAAQAHPNARLWGPLGAREKHPELSWHGILGETPWPFESELGLLPIPGMPKMNESAFLHRPSKALYLTDMVFNIKEPRGLAAWMFFGMFGTYKRFAVSKLFLRFAKDRAAFDAAIATLAGLDFEHVIPSHGEAMLNEGKPRLLAAFRERGLIQ